MDGFLRRSNKPDPCHYCLSSAISLRHSASETWQWHELLRWTKRSLESLESKHWHLLPWISLVCCFVHPIRVVLPIFTSCQWKQGKFKKWWDPHRRVYSDGESYKGLSWCLSILVYSKTLSTYHNAMSVVQIYIYILYMCIYIYIYISIHAAPLQTHELSRGRSSQRCAERQKRLAELLCRSLKVFAHSWKFNISKRYGSCEFSE